MDSAIQLAKLRLDGGTQPRVKIDTDVVDDYAERIKAGDEFPPVVVFSDGAAHWLAEGFHRYHAHAKAGKKTIRCDIRKGTVREAILFSCGANVAHGLRRTNPDKQRAVMTLLKDEEWAKYSDRKIADICCVDNSTVSSYRKQLLESNSSAQQPKRIGADGKLRPATQPKREPNVSRLATVRPTGEPDDGPSDPEGLADVGADEAEEVESSDDCSAGSPGVVERAAPKAKAAKGESNVIGDVSKQLIIDAEFALNGLQPSYVLAIFGLLDSWKAEYLQRRGIKP